MPLDDVTEFAKFSILSPWPTVINRQVVSGHEGHAAGLMALAEDGIDGDLFAMDNPAVGWLKKTIDARIKEYFENATKAQGCSWRVEGRLVTRGMNELPAGKLSDGRLLRFRTAPQGRAAAAQGFRDQHPDPG